MKNIWKEMKIITENHIKIIIEYENHMNRNENHKRKSHGTNIIKYENHITRNENHKRKHMHEIWKSL